MIASESGSVTIGRAKLKDSNVYVFVMLIVSGGAVAKSGGKFMFLAAKIPIFRMLP